LRTGLGESGGKAEFVVAWPHETSTGQLSGGHSDAIRAIQLGKAPCSLASLGNVLYPWQK